MKKNNPYNIASASRRKLVASVCGVLCWIGCMSACGAQNIGQGSSLNLDELIARCAPTVHPETMSALLSAESRGYQYAIADAGPVKLPWSQRKSMVRSYYMGSLPEAVAKAKELIANGHTVSLGLSQVNDRNLPRLGLTLDSIFDPCTNIGAGGRIMTDFYERAKARFGDGERALRAALSAYNSGDWLRGEKDGYVDLVYKHAGQPLVLKTSAKVPRLGRNLKIAPNTAQSARIGREFALTSATYSAQ